MAEQTRQNGSDPGSMRTRSRSSDFLIFIALPLMLAALAMMLGAGWLLNGIASSVNAQEETRTWQAVQAAVGSLEDRLAAIAADNAHWDDAVTRTYGTLDTKWTFDNWGVGSADVNYDTMYLLDGDGKLLSAYRQGKDFTIPPSDYLGRSFPGLLAFGRDSKGDFGTLSTITSTPDGIAIIAAAPVLPTSEGITVDAEHPNLAVFISHLTPTVMQKLGSEYIVDGLTLEQVAPEGTGQHVLRDHWDQPVAAASWKPRNPGQIASSTYRNTVIGVVMGLLGMIIPLTFVYFRRLSELEESERVTRYLARHDQLTGLLNRETFVAETEQLARTHRGEHLAMVLIEATNIRDIIDTHGLATGDSVIRELTDRLPGRPGGSPSFARLDGGTFAIAYGGPDCLERAEATANAAIANLRKPVAAGEEQIPMPVSIGIATAAGGRADASELIRRADLALSYARQSGFNQWRLYDGSLDISSQDDSQRRAGGLFVVKTR